MNKILAWLTIFSFVSYISPATNLSAQPQEKAEEGKTFLAVLELENNAGLTEEECSTLSDAVRQEFFSSGRFRVVDRKNMELVLKEQGFQLSDCTTEECAVKVGRLLGVEKMAVGSIGKLGQVYVINLQLLNVETGEIEDMASDRCPCSVEGLLDQVKGLAQKISGPSLPPTRGGMKITSTPEGASVYLDGKEAGQTPLVLSDLKPGDYQVRVSLEGYEPSEEGASVYAGEITELMVALKEIPRTGSLEISANVSNADVYLSGRRIGQIPFPAQAVDPGRYKVRVSKRGYSDWEKMVEVKAGEKQVLRAELEKAIKKAKPWYKKAWVWTIIAVAAGGAAAGVLLTVGGEDGDTGDIDIYL